MSTTIRVRAVVFLCLPRVVTSSACTLILAATLTDLPSGLAGEQLAGRARVTDSEWKVVIVPASDETLIRAAVSGDSVGLASVPSDEPPVSAASGTRYPRMSYEEAYSSIPFSRAEYEANPSYRHDAAMELMLGAPRPTTIVRQTVPYFSRYPDFIRNRFNVFPYAPSNSGIMDVNLNWRTNVMAY